MTVTRLPPTGSALLNRLSRLAHLDPADVAAIALAERDQRRWQPRREIVVEGEPVRERRAIVSGWACHQRILSDGRRQVISFLLPGDLIGMRRHHGANAATTISAVSEVVSCAVPDVHGGGEGLPAAYALSAALEDHYLTAQITRLGKLSAIERLADWSLETYDRLALAGLADGDQMAMPLTQEFLADTLGLTSVHVNRTLQSMHRDGLLTSQRGIIVLDDRGRLERMIDYRPAHGPRADGGGRRLWSSGVG